MFASLQGAVEQLNKHNTRETAISQEQLNIKYIFYHNYNHHKAFVNTISQYKKYQNRSLKVNKH